MMNKRKTRLVNRAKEIVLIPFALMLVLVFSAYTNNIAEEIPQDKQRKKIEKDSWTIKKDSDTRVVSERKIVGGDTWTVEQDQDKKKKEKKSEKEHVTIMIDGKMFTLKDASGLVDKEGDITIIKLSDLKDQEGERISRKKLIERIEEIKSEDENTIIMIKESDEGEDEVDVYALVSGVSSSLKEGPIYLKKEKDGSIEISTTAGDSKVMYISGSEGDKKKIHIRTDGKGEDFLILIDDKISSEEALNDLDADKIYSIEILDSEEAKKEFGDKAKDGVIKVKTKK